MADYDLYYWPVPFRGQFIRAILAWAGKSWDEQDAGAVEAAMSAAAAEQAVPHMGPPMLIDKAAGFALAEMPAIALYLGETLGLLPGQPGLKALHIKLVNDANDVIDEVTRQGGMKMWTPGDWAEFEPRLKRWMSFWEEMGRRHGLTKDGGFLLGEAAGVADVVTAVLWGVMGARFPKIAGMLEEEAPMTAALVGRLNATPAMAELAAWTEERFGDAYCGGQIEASLRKVLAA
jgi:glutathione S-transferase